MKATLMLSVVLHIVSFFAVYESTAVCKDGDFMKDPDSCDHFFKCDHGKPVKFACGPGTWFNPDINVCDYPYNVKCDVNPGGQKPSGGGSGQQNNNGYSGNKPNNGGQSSGQYDNPSTNQQGQNNRPNQGQNGSPQNTADGGYQWPIQTPNSGSDSPNNGGQNGEERPRPTIDDLFSGNNNPYQEYLGNNHF